MSDLKEPVKIAQEQLGTPAFRPALNLYTHVVDASHRQAVEAVEDRLFGQMAEYGLKSSPAVDQPDSESSTIHET